MNDQTKDWGLFINKFVQLSDEISSGPEIKNCYALYIVTDGKGVLNSAHVSYNITKGDIFLTIAHQGYSIKSTDNLRCIYIGFMGMRGVELSKGLLDYVKIPIFNGYESFISLWENAYEMSKKIDNPILAEGLLLYTLGSIPGRGVLKGEYKKRQSIMLQTYIRSNFNNPDLSLEMVANAFGYSKKYLSDLFKRKFDITFTDFLKKVRLENASSLMQLGNTSVSSISALCGFTDPLYFSKLFKEKYGESPRSYIAKLKQ